MISTSYRHSQQLNQFAHVILRREHGDVSPAELPEHVDNEGVSPALGTGLSTDAEMADWIAERVGEIENISGVMPSVAVFVDTEERVLSVAKALYSALSLTNITAVPCQGGLVVDQDDQVRVFDVRHIKGLEFEAAFFVGLDRLAEREPDLLTKYLYVGTTRGGALFGYYRRSIVTSFDPGASALLR